MRGITKRFPGVVADDNVDLMLLSGEVHALLGENGSGKTTLMSVLSGLWRPDEGVVLLDGRPVSFRSPLDAIRNGIGMVHQEFALVRTLTVAENVMLGREVTRGPFLDAGRTREYIRSICEQYQIAVDPDARVEQLSIGEQQRVEILKVLYRGARVLILDEPTALLTSEAAERLFLTIRAAAMRGQAVVLITHKLREVLAASDRVTVLRKGRVVGCLRTGDTTATALAELMVGRQIDAPPARIAWPTADPVLAVRDLRVRGERQRDAVRGVSFGVARGEIVGIAGVEGNGQQDLVEAIVGLRRPLSGDVRVSGRTATSGGSSIFRDAGGAYIPADRRGVGAVAQFTIAENLILRTHGQAPFLRRGLLQKRAIVEHAERAIRTFDIRGRADQLVGLLSGGNLQKVILARELEGAPVLVIAAQPTRGLDIVATQFVHHELMRRRNEGAAVLLVSADLDEIQSLADRILVMFEGQVVGEVLPGPEARSRIGLLLGGAQVASA
jgi:general nucleoside transport system ATP-binding protein